MRSFAYGRWLVTAGVCLAAAGYGAAVSAGTVTLTNNDKVTGTIIEQTEEGVRMEHPDLGEMVIASEQIKAIELEESDPVYVEPPVPEFIVGWDKSLELGLNGSDGNSDTINFFGRFETGYEDDLDRWKIDADYSRFESDGVTTRDEGSLGVAKDWLEPDEDYFYFANARYEYDRFTDYESRVTAAIGVGYEFLDDGTHMLLGRAGVGGNYEFGDVNDFIPELVFGIEYVWQIKKNHKFSAYNTILPAIDPLFGEFRNNSGVAYQILIDHANGLSLKFGADNEFNSEVEPGTEENDLTYYASLVYDF
ncbi:MAG: DUF481 domain-containing protein [Planctomycetota bacterium]